MGGLLHKVRQQAKVGTVGGKIGFVAGAVVALSVSVDMAQLILGACFLEEGCPNETVGLGAAAGASFLIGVVAGLLVRRVVNRVFGIDRNVG